MFDEFPDNGPDREEQRPGAVFSAPGICTLLSLGPLASARVARRVAVSMSRSMRSASTAPTSTLVWPRCRGTTSTLRRHPTSGIDGRDLFDPAQTGFAGSLESFDSLNRGQILWAV